MIFIIVSHKNKVLNTKGKFQNIVKSLRPMRFESRDDARDFVADNNLTKNYKISTINRIKKEKTK